MTTPDNFEYSDDSVVARVSVEVPDTALTDILKLSEAMGNMRAQLQSVSDAQQEWAGFLGQMPDTITSVNDAIKEQITLLERQSYLMSGGSFTGPAGAQAGGGGAGYGGIASYSTAAQPGYGQGPWGQGTPGMGMGMMVAGMNQGQAAQKIERIEAENPGLAENMEAQRERGGGGFSAGGAAAVGAAASAIARRFGGGGAGIPQKTSSGRTSFDPADPEKGGAPMGAEDPNTPGDPSPNESDQVKKQTLLAQVMDEFKSGSKDGRAARLGDILATAAGQYMLNGRGGGGRSGGTDDGDDAGGGDKTASKLAGFLGKYGPMGKMAGGVVDNILGSTAAKAVGGLGLAAYGFNKVQDIGERITDFQQLGSVQGGDYMTGMKYEAQARMIGLNPFISTEQARQAMQMALKEGFRGDNYDNVKDFMIDNFKEMGISMGQSMDVMKSHIRNLSEGDDISGVRSNLSKTINTMKELSAEGGASLPERMNQMEQMSAELSSQGFTGESISRAVLGTQEGFGDSMALRGAAGTRIGTQITGSNMLMTMAAQKMGLNGHLPGALPRIMQEAGLDQDEIRDIAASNVAGMVNGYSNKADRIAAFQMLMNQYGVEMDFTEAEALYDKVSGGKELPSQAANRKIGRQGKTQTSGGGGRTSSLPADSDWTKRHPNYRPSENAEGTSENFDEAGRGTANFAGTGRPPVPPPSSMQSAGMVSAKGTVTGEVRITVDQQGRVTAPQVVQLTGQQKAAYAGYGSAQLNNAPPGDPSYNGAWNGFSAPAGGR